MSFLTKKERRQLELLGVEPEARKLPVPMWIQSAAVGATKLLLMATFAAVAMNIAASVVNREIIMQKQQEALRQTLK